MKGVAANESRHRHGEARGMEMLRVTGGEKGGRVTAQINTPLRLSFKTISFFWDERKK